MGRDTFSQAALGVSLQSRIKESKLLMVGAGGIGCELLKNLILSGFGEVHIVDLDTIDLSNLNRQFLFNMKHIKKSKAIIAKEVAGKFNTKVKLEAHHADITHENFDVKWFKDFDIVFNALDNLAARRHVNVMCLAADVPLIESGTTGFNGQVQVIKKGVTQCYDCTPKAVTKSFPVCTIRSTPSQPIHCIVWAKSYLFNEVFGQSDESADQINQNTDTENAQELATLKLEALELERIRENLGSSEFARKIFDKVFDCDIHRLTSMKEMWISRKAPVALKFKDLASTSTSSVDVATFLSNDQNTWTLSENFHVFIDSLTRLSKRAMAKSSETGERHSLSFDKDDEDTLDFVAASANLRSYIFGIQLKSKFDIKQMAGNIIPAIATTNAITAGLCVMQAFKVLRQKLDEAKMVFLSVAAERALTSEPLQVPNVFCNICGILRLNFIVDTHRATLRDLVEIYLMKQLAYSQFPTVTFKKTLIYDVEYDDEIDNTLHSLGIKEGSVIEAGDESEDSTKVNINLHVIHKSIPNADHPFIQADAVTIPLKPLQPTAVEKIVVNGRGHGIRNSGLTEVDFSTASKKRKLDAILESTIVYPGSKRNKSDLVDLTKDGPIELD